MLQPCGVGEFILLCPRAAVQAVLSFSYFISLSVAFFLLRSSPLLLSPLYLKTVSKNTKVCAGSAKEKHSKNVVSWPQAGFGGFCQQRGVKERNSIFYKVSHHSLTCALPCWADWPVSRCCWQCGIWSWATIPPRHHAPCSCPCQCGSGCQGGARWQTRAAVGVPCRTDPESWTAGSERPPELC